MTNQRTNALQMIDVGAKKPTQRIAIAMGKIFVGADAFQLIREKKLPKGDALFVAEIAGIQAAKNTSQLLPLCHPLNLDHVRLQFEYDEIHFSITAYCQVSTVSKTGVEMEALVGVNAALLCIYDLSKMINPALRMSDVRLLLKTGGKKGAWIHPEGIPDWLRASIPEEKLPLADMKVAVVTLSDRATAGVYADESGKILKDFLIKAGAQVLDQALFPDDFETLKKYLKEIADAKKVSLVLLTGGTGVAPRDITPEVLELVCDRMIPGIGELLRSHGAQFTQFSWVSRSCAGICNQTLLIALPGNPKAIMEGLPVILPLLKHLTRSLSGAEHHD